jgi:hypothetical protein
MDDEHSKKNVILKVIDGGRKTSRKLQYSFKGFGSNSKLIHLKEIGDEPLDFERDSMVALSDEPIELVDYLNEMSTREYNLEETTEDEFNKLFNSHGDFRQISGNIAGVLDGYIVQNFIYSGRLAVKQRDEIIVCGVPVAGLGSGPIEIPQRNLKIDDSVRLLVQPSKYELYYIRAFGNDTQGLYYKLV